jgi:hypothetical protein
MIKSFKILIFIVFTAVSMASLSSQETKTGDGLIKVEAKRWEKNKPNMPWQFFETETLTGLKSYVPEPTPTNARGSLTEKNYGSTGFFRTMKIDNRWWVIDPEGFPGIQMVVNGVRKGTSEQTNAAFSKLFKSDDDWMCKTFGMLNNLVFNGIGSWSHTDAVQASNALCDKKFSYTLILNFMSSYGRKRGGTYQLPGNIGYPNQCIFVFDPEFERFCMKEAAEISKFKNDPNLIGYFSDNELPFGMANLEGYLTLPNPVDPGRKFAEKWLSDKGVTKAEITDSIRSAFAGVVAERYYSIVSKALKAADPNHMFLGSRLHGGAKNIESVIRASGKFSDIVSINYYGSWTPNAQLMENWGVWAQKPFMITEFYTKAMDSGLANTTGAGFTVRTQHDRGLAYQHFCMNLLKSKNCVGWHWFKYQDNDPTAKGVDPSNFDSNKGMVDNRYNWYTALTDQMKAFNGQVYSLIRYFDATSYQ